MSEWSDRSLSGCIFEHPRVNAPVMRFAATQSPMGDASFPQSVDLRAHCTPVEDQGRTNSCTANAVVGAMEFHLHKRDGRVTDLSRLFVYFNTRRLNGTVAQDNGARISEAMAAALAYGACRAQLWPFDLARMGEQPPQTAYLDGMGHEAMQYARVPGIEGAVRGLAEGLPVVFGCFLSQRMYDEAAVTGRIPTSTEAERGAQPTFGHAMLLVGYDLADQSFIVRNSWGPRWGEQGYCRLPFQEAAYFAPMEAFWVLASLEPKQSFSVANPYAAAPPPPLRSAPEPVAAPQGALSAASPSSVFGKAPAARPAPSALAGGGSVKSELERMKAELRGEMAAQRQSLSDRIGALRGKTGAPGGAAPSRAAPPSIGPAPSGGPPPGGGDLGRTVCSMCGGTGGCFYCTSSYDCGHCNGSGNCNVCWGTGFQAAAPDAPSAPLAPGPVSPGSAAPDGSLGAQECQMCYASGVCYQCHGSKFNMGYPCNACYYSGKCSACGGSGIY